jgi:chemotaxis protein CheC
VTDDAGRPAVGADAAAGDRDGAVQLNVSTLGTFYEMAREGAGLAADRLSGMTGVPTRVGVTRLNFMHGDDIRAEMGEGRRVGVRVELSGGFGGSTVVAFDADGADRVVEALLTDVSEEGVADIEESAITELCHVMNSGLIDGWADVLDTAIDISPPTFVAGDGPEEFLSGVETPPGDDDLALLFQSRIETVGAELGFEHYLFPERDTVFDHIERRHRTTGGGGIGYDKLIGFDRMAEQGADEVADNLSTMTGVDMDVDIRRINFLSLDTIPEEVPDEELVSVAFELSGTPSGYLVFVLDLPSARRLVAETVPGSDGALDAMGRDALQEFGNVMASGFIDGWANVLETTIDHTPPEFTRDLGAAVVDPLLIGLSRRQEFAFVFDTVIEAADDRGIDVRVYAIPDEDDLERALAALDLSRVGAVPTKAEFDVGSVERDGSVGTDGLDGGVRR